MLRLWCIICIGLIGLTGCGHVGSQNHVRLRIIEIQHDVDALKKADVKSLVMRMEMISIMEMMVNEIESLRKQIEDYSL